jgi:signal transduction histidine kinase
MKGLALGDNLAGSEEMNALMRSHRWERTPLGPPEAWPQSLRTVTNILLTSRYAMWMGWGQSLTVIYNDSYLPTLGIKHPWALGQPAAQVWAEIWPEIGPRIRSVLATGKATYDEGLLLFLERSGFPEETYHTFSYSPLADDNGAVCGFLCVVTEETERIISERRMGTLRDLAASLGSTNTESEVYSAVERELARNPKDLPFTLTYVFKDDGEARLACATNLPLGHAAAPARIAAGENHPWPASRLFHHTAARVAEIAGVPAGAWNKPPVEAAVVPIRQQGHDNPAGFLVVGVNPYRHYDDAYRGFVELIAGQLASGLSNARAYEAERIRANALAELDRAKTAFFSNVSHEFRTPLTLMLGPVEDLLASPNTFANPENRELLQVVHRNGLRLQRLVNTLLDFSRIEAGREQASYQATDLPALTAELASSFRSAMERAGLDFNVECPPLPEPVFVDREMWEKIVLNLVSNAFKYTLEGSVSVRLAPRDKGVELSVSDSGVGISPEELPRLFERFHRAEQTRGRTHEGTGIGLALVQELVKLHQGAVTVQSELGRGSRFAVWIPFGSGHLPKERIGAARNNTSTALHSDAYVEEALRWLSVSDAAAEERRAPVAASHVRARVLLADDNGDMREYVRRLLSEEYDVVTASNGEEALRMALSRPPDLVLSDVMMPVLDGIGLLQALRKNPATRAVPVILLSARAGEESKVEGLESGADDYLVKPFSARELTARVGAHLALRRQRQQAQDQLTQTFQQAPVGIVVFRGEDFVVELANPIYRSFIRGRDLIGRRLGDVVPELEPHIWAALRSVLETGQPIVANDLPAVYDQDGDGVVEQHWFNIVYHPLQEADHSVSGVIAVLTEVTAQVRARMELERANRELEEFAYASSHDLQEPLRMVGIYSQLLLEQVPGTDRDAQMYAEVVRNGVLQMEALIKDLLTYSRTVHPEQDEAHSADLNQSLQEALGTLQMRIEETGAVIESANCRRSLANRGNWRWCSKICCRTPSSIRGFRNGRGSPSRRLKGITAG